MPVSVKISRVCAKVIPIKKVFLGHGMDQIQRATLSLAICVFSAVLPFSVSSSSWVFLEGFERAEQLLPPAALERGYYT